ncbi:MAG: hypothetical protein E4H14_01460 [Candidatus Thorarchaeota archaeon]|nr:MAG: hypothetical protein E4H14_01460 [Candidatus Thorarchaeota archaeon]
MKLFSESEQEIINNHLQERKGSYLITFRNKHGPTKLKQLWTEMLEEITEVASCLSWWSSGGQIGLLECETNVGMNIYGQWVLDDNHELIAVREVDEEDLVNIRDGCDAGSVISSEMRAMRIGESGGAKE